MERKKPGPLKNGMGCVTKLQNRIVECNQKGYFECMAYSFGFLLKCSCTSCVVCEKPRGQYDNLGSNSDKKSLGNPHPSSANTVELMDISL